MQANRDTWHWVSGKTVSYIFWGEGQPNNYNREQNCAVLDSQLDWRWNDLSCKVNLYFGCNISIYKGLNLKSKTTCSIFIFLGFFSSFYSI